MRLLVTSGRGPAECRIAVQKAVRLIEREAADAGLACTRIAGPEHGQGHGPASVVLILDGDAAGTIAASWIGTLQWIARSPVRPNHKRKNWFVSISALSEIEETEALCREDVSFEAFRAGGPGGQHQNTTDSAVRATHLPTNTSVVVRDGRSQHQNKSIALKRLAEILDVQSRIAQGKLQDEAQSRHDSLERGNPARVLRD